MKGVVDLNRYKEMKNKKKKYQKPELDPNEELLKELVKQPIEELDDEHYKCYCEIAIVFTTLFRDKHIVIVVEFRGEYYVLNNLGGGIFQYLGKFNDILDYYM